MAARERPQVLIVRDTRESGGMLEAALAAGVSSAGADVLLGGILPTPAAPLLLRRYGLDLAAVISASHNPYADNGIKFFAADGFKISDEQEQQIEAELAQHDRGRRRCAPAVGRIRELRGAHEDYLRELHTRFARLTSRGEGCARLRKRRDLQGRAGDVQAPGAQVSVLADQPDGRNINAGCGSTHIDALLAGDAARRARCRLCLRR